MKLLWTIRLGLPAVLAVIGLAAFLQSFDFPPLARYFPLVVSAALTILCVALVVINAVKLARNPVESLKVGGSNDTSGLLVEAWVEGPEESTAVRRRIGVALLVLAVAIVTMVLLGSVLGAGVFIALAQWRLVKARWWVIVGSGLVTSGAVWLMSYQFRLTQPHGVLGDLLGLTFGLR